MADREHAVAVYGAVSVWLSEHDDVRSVVLLGPDGARIALDVQTARWLVWGGLPAGLSWATGPPPGTASGPPEE